MIANIVVGLGYGDEGKGITTDYLCSKAKVPSITCVIRYSGGQQAGHTVMLENTKHIFSNFGAGTLRGIATYFSEHTTFYPLSIAKELHILNLKGITNPRLMIHPLAKLTTPYDVFANRRESEAGSTCGLGVGKTVERNEEGKYQLYAVDLINLDILKIKLFNIKSDYYKHYESDFDLTDAEQQEVMAFEEAIRNIAWEINDYHYIRNHFKHFIFEGAQGVLLDRDHGVYPHNTYTHTTSCNAHEVCDKLNIVQRNMYYVTRCYSTRHGNGPYQQEEILLKNNHEEINVQNEWQGMFKTSKLDYSLVDFALCIDAIYTQDKAYSTNLVVTCNDQIVDEANKFDRTKLQTEFNNILMSHSPKSEDFVYL